MMGWLIKPFGFALILAVVVLSYYGLFRSVVVQEETMGPFLIVYEKHTGEYKKTISVAVKLNQTLREEADIRPLQNFGLYFDDPKTTSTEQLRSIGGCIIQESSSINLDKLKEQFHVAQLDSAPCAVVEFPYKGVISILVGTYKVYPKLQEYMDAQGRAMGPVMEIYDDTQHTLTYIASLEWYQNMTEQLLSVTERS